MNSAPDPGTSWAAIGLRAVLYAAAITLLVLYAPQDSHVFLYQNF